MPRIRVGDRTLMRFGRFARRGATGTRSGLRGRTPAPTVGFDQSSRGRHPRPHGVRPGAMSPRSTASRPWHPGRSGARSSTSCRLHAGAGAPAADPGRRRECRKAQEPCCVSMRSNACSEGDRISTTRAGSGTSSAQPPNGPQSTPTSGWRTFPPGIPFAASEAKGWHSRRSSWLAIARRARKAMRSRPRSAPAIMTGRPSISLRPRHRLLQAAWPRDR